MILSDDIVELAKQIVEIGAETSWMVLGYSDGDLDTVRLLGSGSGDYDEFCANFTDDVVLYGFHRFTMSIDDENRNQKCILVTWIPNGAPRALKGAVLNHKHDVRDPLAGKYRIDFQASIPDDLDYSSVEKKLKQAQGAEYDNGGLYNADRTEKIDADSEGTIEGEATGQTKFVRAKPKARGARRLNRRPAPAAAAPAPTEEPAE